MVDARHIVIHNGAGWIVAAEVVLVGQCAGNIGLWIIGSKLGPIRIELRIARRSRSIRCEVIARDRQASGRIDELKSIYAIRVERSKRGGEIASYLSWRRNAQQQHGTLHFTFSLIGKEEVRLVLDNWPADAATEQF